MESQSLLPGEDDEYYEKILNPTGVKPFTSTQMPYSQKFAYHKKNLKTMPIAQGNAHNILPTASKLPNNDTVNENNVILHEILKEVKLLRREARVMQLSNGKKEASDSISLPFTLPCTTPDEFENLELKLKSDENAKKHFIVVY